MPLSDELKGLMQEPFFKSMNQCASIVGASGAVNPANIIIEMSQKGEKSKGVEVGYASYIVQALQDLEVKLSKNSALYQQGDIKNNTNNFGTMMADLSDTIEKMKEIKANCIKADQLPQRPSRQQSYDSVSSANKENRSPSPAYSSSYSESYVDNRAKGPIKHFNVINDSSSSTKDVRKAFGDLYEKFNNMSPKEKVAFIQENKQALKDAVSTVYRKIDNGKIREGGRTQEMADHLQGFIRHVEKGASASSKLQDLTDTAERRFGNR